MSSKLPWGRIWGATLLTPPVAAVGAVSICVLVAPFLPHAWIYLGGNWILSILFGTILFAPLSVGFAIITQIPLAMLHARYFKVPQAMHLVVSGALGIALLVGFYRHRDMLTTEVTTAVVGGLGGGLSVGLLWNLLVLRRIDRNG